jgi:hypothetical protein
MYTLHNKHTVYREVFQCSVRCCFVVGPLVVVELQAHSIVNLVVLQCDVVFVDCVPFLNANLFWSRARLRCNQFFQVSDCVVLVALHSHLFPQSVITDNFNHILCTACFSLSLSHTHTLYVCMCVMCVRVCDQLGRSAVFCCRLLRSS